MNYRNSTEPIPEPCQPPESITLSEQESHPPSHTSIMILQLNTHRSEAVLQNLLQTQTHHVLLIQEPWIRKYNLLPVSHPSWHLVMPMGHNPTSLDDRAKSCIYITKQFPTKTFTALPTNSALLTAIDIDDSDTNLRLRVLSWYNPPSDFGGLPVLKHWLQHRNR